MRTRAREHAIWIALAALGSATLAWLGLLGFAWNDYDNEARPAVSALVHGHLHQFFSLAPVYGGSLLERAPFALLPNIWGGGELAVYRMLALPCLASAAVLAVWLASWMRRHDMNLRQSGLALLLCVGNPLTLLALEIGHPDELLGGVLCVLAVLLATRGHSVRAALALGLAISNKQWAVLAIPCVLVALPARRLLCVWIASATTAVFTLPFLLFASSAFATNLHGAATSTTGLFNPWQLWWFFGHVAPHSSVATEAFQNYRVPPVWVTKISHPLIVALAFPLGASVWLRLRSHDRHAKAAGANRQGAALILLSLLLLLRCMLDPWDNIYYPIPFVLALLVWESVDLRRAPLLAFAVTIAVYAGHHALGTVASPDIQAAFFTLWSTPLACGLAIALVRHTARNPSGAPLSVDGHQFLREARQDLVPVGG
jgi:hypothetical protein